MEQLSLPNQIELIKDKDPHKATLIVSPCHPGYGTTIGNALRRVLLSSLPGAAVTAVKIEGADHEFTTIPNVKEDVVQIILNLKQLRLKSFSSETVRLNLKAEGERTVTAADIEPNADVEIVNTDLHLATLTNKDAKFDMEIIVRQGRGYVPIEEREEEKKEIGIIGIDSVFTPIRSVGYRVEDVRVGQKTNYDKLTLTLETDGTINPAEAVNQAIQILLDHLNLFVGLEVMTVKQAAKKKEAEEKKEEELKEQEEAEVAEEAEVVETPAEPTDEAQPSLSPEEEKLGEEQVVEEKAPEEEKNV